jgi:hypothetical protein
MEVSCLAAFLHFSAIWLYGKRGWFRTEGSLGQSCFATLNVIKKMKKKNQQFQNEGNSL